MDHQTYIIYTFLFNIFSIFLFMKPPTCPS